MIRLAVLRTCGILHMAWVCGACGASPAAGWSSNGRFNMKRLAHFGVVAVVVFVSSANVIAQCGSFEAVQKLTASDPSPEDHFGWSVGVSSNRAIVGAYTDDIGADTNAGSAYVFRWNGSVWVQEAWLTGHPSGSPPDEFGYGVSIHTDRAVVSGRQQSEVFRWNGIGWESEGLLIAPPGNGDSVGSSVAIWGDRAIVGEYGHDIGGLVDAGAAEVYRWTGSAWVHEATLTAGDPAIGDYFGIAVSLDGDRALIGAYGDDESAPDGGAAYVFKWSGSAWLQEAKLLAADGGADDLFGNSVSLSGDCALVGAFLDDNEGGNEAGAAYVFCRNGSVWAQQGKILAADGMPDDRFGESVSLSDDRGVVGASRDDTSDGADAGSVYSFRWNGATWVQEVQLVAADAGIDDRFGRAVAHSGVQAVFGAASHNAMALTDAGAAYAFRLPAHLAILREPVAATESCGSPAGFSVVATGSPEPIFQWRHNGTPLLDGGAPGGGQIIGASTTALILTGVSQADEGIYQCFVSDGCYPTIVSTPVILEVEAACPGDADGNCTVNFADVTAVLGAFNSICPQ